MHPLEQVTKSRCHIGTERSSRTLLGANASFLHSIDLFVGRFENATTARSARFVRSSGRAALGTRLLWSARTSIRRLEALLADCAAIVIGVDDAATSDESVEQAVAASQAMLELVPTVLALGLGGQQLVMHGRTRCMAAARRLYLAENWARFPGGCWRTTWTELVATMPLAHARCVEGLLAPDGGNDLTWCSAELPKAQVSACAAEPPLLPRAWHAAASKAAGTVAPDAASVARDGTLDGGRWRSSASVVHFRGRMPSRWGGRSVDPHTNRTAAAVPLSRIVRRHARYYSLILDRDDRVCMLLKDASSETQVLGVCSEDDGATFDGDAALVVPSLWHQPSSLTHNLAAVRLPVQHLTETPERSTMTTAGRPTRRPLESQQQHVYLLIGGKSSERQLRLQRRDARRASAGSPRRSHPCVACWGWDVMGTGLWLLRSDDWRFSADRAATPALPERIRDPWPSVVRPHWQGPRLLLDGRHDGCISRRIAKVPCYNCKTGAPPSHLETMCEFDGRVSFVRHRGRFHLYVRANNGSHAQRFVQHTSSTDLVHWRPLALIQIGPAGQYTSVQGDIYYWAAQPNPVHNESVLAMAPLTHRLRGCIGLSLSLDGRRWTLPAPLLSCPVWGERTEDHPVGSGVHRRGNTVFFFIHRQVPGIRFDATTPLALARTLRAMPAEGHLVRYQISADALAQWTAERVKSLARDEV